MPRLGTPTVRFVVFRLILLSSELSLCQISQWHVGRAVGRVCDVMFNPLLYLKFSSPFPLSTPLSPSSPPQQRRLSFPTLPNPFRSKKDKDKAAAAGTGAASPAPPVNAPAPPLNTPAPDTPAFAATTAPPRSGISSGASAAPPKSVPPLPSGASGGDAQTEGGRSAAQDPEKTPAAGPGSSVVSETAAAVAAAAAAAANVGVPTEMLPGKNLPLTGGGLAGAPPSSPISAPEVVAGSTEAGIEGGAGLGARVGVENAGERGLAGAQDRLLGTVAGGDAAMRAGGTGGVPPEVEKEEGGGEERTGGAVEGGAEASLEVATGRVSATQKTSGAPGAGADVSGRPSIPMDLSTETMLGGVGSRERGAQAGVGEASQTADDAAAVESILQAT